MIAPTCPLWVDSSPSTGRYRPKAVLRARPFPIRYVRSLPYRLPKASGHIGICRNKKASKRRAILWPSGHIGLALDRAERRRKQPSHEINYLYFKDLS